jgi:hypothetical protein
MMTGGTTGGAMAGGATGGMTGGTTGGVMTGGMTGGTTGGVMTGGMTGGTTGGEMIGGETTGGSVPAGDCTAACMYLDNCSTQICPMPLIGAALGDCVAQCEEDITAFNPSAVLMTSCDDVNAGFCQQGAGQAGCNCPDTGVNDCGDIYSCLVECGQEDEACQNMCIANGSPAGTTALNALFQCLETSCAAAASDEEFQACADMNCANEINGCFAGGGGGAAFCLDSCDPAADTCGDGLFCLDIGEGAAICAAGTMDMPAFPEGATTECTGDADCGPNQLCVTGG